MMHHSWWPPTWGGLYERTWREPRPVTHDFERDLEEPERVGPHRRRAIEKIKAHDALRAVLGGVLFENATTFPLPEGGVLGPLKLGNDVLRFSIWAPHRRVVIDVTPHQLAADVVRAKDEFATKHGLRYIVVYTRGTLPLDDLKALLATPAAADSGRDHPRSIPR